jgi:hypothetical protein
MLQNFARPVHNYSPDQEHPGIRYSDHIIPPLGQFHAHHSFTMSLSILRSSYQSSSVYWLATGFIAGIGFAITTTSRSAFRPTQSRIKWVSLLGALSSGVKRPESEDDHSLSGCVELRLYFLTFLHVVFARHEENFVFIWTSRIKVDLQGDPFVLSVTTRMLYEYLFPCMLHILLISSFCDNAINLRTDFNIVPTSTIRKNTKWI